jgi:hypothetical protein
VEEQFNIVLEKLAKEYPEKGYDKVLNYNINEYLKKAKLDNPVAEKNNTISFTTRVKVWVRDTIYSRQSYSAVKKQGLKNAVVLFLGNTIDTRELVPLYEELLNNKIDCFLFSNKHHIYTQLKQKFNILYVPTTVQKKTLKLDSNKIGALAESIIANNYTKNIDWLKKANAVIKEFSPKAIVSTNDLLPEQRILNEAANKKSITTVCQQHGTINKGSAYAYSNSKYWFVYGQHTKDILEELGINKDRVFITGTSYLEKYVSNDTSADKVQIKELQLVKNGNKPFLILFSGKGHSTTKENYELQLEAAEELAKNNSNNEFLVKLHPKEEAIAYKNFTMPNCRVLTHQEFTNAGYDLISLIGISQGIITGMSASIFEAITMGKIVFTLDCLQEYESYEIIQNNISVHSTSKSQLADNFDKFISTPTHFDELKKNATAFAQKYFHVSDLSSASRKVEVIKQLVF